MKHESLQDIYASLPSLNCQGKCQAYCGPVAFSPVEATSLESKNIPIPHVRNSLKWGNLSCSALDGKGKCSIYNNRPLVCRLWGLTKTLQCSYGCQPERWLSDKEARKLIGAMQQLQKGQDITTIGCSNDERADKTID